MTVSGPVRRALAFAGLIALASVLAAFLAPLGASLVAAGGTGSVRTGGSVLASAAGELRAPFFEVRILRALWFTVAQAFLSSVAAMLIGIPAAFLTARRSFPFRRALLALSGVPLCVPPAIIALAFVLFYGRQGYLNGFLTDLFAFSQPPVSFLYSMAGIVFAHGFYNFPVVMRTVSQSWERIPESSADAATLLGASPFRVFCTVTLPSLSGALLSSAILVFLYCFFSFVIVLLFGAVGVTTLEVELYQAARSSLDFALAGQIAAVETLAASVFVALYAWALRRASPANSGLRAARPRRKLSGTGEKILAALFLAGILVFFIGPLASVGARSLMPAGADGSGIKLSVEAWKTLLGRPGFGSALLNTLRTGVSTAAFSTAAALFFALYGALRRTSSGAGAFLSSAVPLAPLAVSSVMLGFGWTLLFPAGSPLVLVLAQSAVCWPIVWSQIQASLERIPRPVLEAAELLSAGRLDRAFRACIPLAWKGILSGAAFAFAFSAGDATLPLVLSLGRYENLALRLFRLAGAYRFAEACACAIVVALLCAAAFFFQDAERADAPVESCKQEKRI